MQKILVILSIITGIGMAVLAFPEGIFAFVLTAAMALIVIFFIGRAGVEKEFLTNIFIIALLLRIAVGLFIHIYDLRDFFGGDALTFDAAAKGIIKIWQGYELQDAFVQRMMSILTPGFGINYLVAAIYFIFGENILAAQSFCAVVGAATAPMVYVCAISVFNNHKVGRICSVCTAVFPAFIIWSGQLLKDGLVVFLLVLSMTLVVKLLEKFSYTSVLLLILSLLGILSLRFYIFYMVAVAIVGSFIIGQSNSIKSIWQRGVALVIVGLALTYFGAVSTASENFEAYGNLERVQSGRLDQQAAGSGFNTKDIDVTTTQGALSAIPISFIYLMFAPFPWQLGSFRQSIVLPEMVIWWLSIPFAVSGIIYTLRYRLRKAIPILIFTVMLTLAYSVFQGNVGTAYRQRTQIQVFIVIFIAVGYTLRQEQRENRILEQNINKLRLKQIRLKT